MQCSNPFLKGGLAFGCGQCQPCRINKKREWMHRIILEASQYEENAFVTLTYSDEFLPEGGTLVPQHVQLFLKRLRKSWEPRRLRFFAVGEYGDQTNRPHYHLALFGYPTCRKGLTHVRPGRGCCAVCDGVQSVWSSGNKPMGNVYLGGLSKDSAGYVAGYVTKKLTAKDDERLGGRHPEFARMSTRPGLGCGMMDEVASTLLEYPLNLEDVPGVLEYGKGHYLPLGRYLKEQLRLRYGREKKAPESVIQKAEEKLRPLREIAYTTAPPGSKAFMFKNLIIDAGEGKRIRKLHAQRKTKGVL
ncbi:replication initiator protein [Apis mellifera associated microvirus 42]|nr:replication initiator protein [Apis mellifera associated microvirus 42]